MFLLIILVEEVLSHLWKDGCAGRKVGTGETYVGQFSSQWARGCGYCLYGAGPITGVLEPPVQIRSSLS